MKSSLAAALGSHEQVSERDEAQGVRSAEHETYQLDRRVGEHRTTRRFARVATCSGLPLLLSAAFACYAESLTYGVRLEPEFHSANSHSPFYPGLPHTALGRDQGDLQFEVKARQWGVNLAATTRVPLLDDPDTEKRFHINELFADATLFGERFSIGKKVLSWDVGFAFRPLDVLQQEDRRVVIPPTLEGVTVVAWDKFSENAALTVGVANPGRGKAGKPRDDASWFARYYVHRGEMENYLLARWSERNRLEAGGAFTYVADGAFEWHGSLLLQERYEKALNSLAARDDLTIPLSQANPVSPVAFDFGKKALLGFTWTSPSGLSVLGEAWHDNNAYSVSEWKKLRTLALRQGALLHMAGIPQDAVTGNVAYDLAYYEKPNLLRNNLLLRTSWRKEDWSFDPALDILYTPADGGLVTTATLKYAGNNYIAYLGLREYGGRKNSAYRQLPEDHLVFFSLQRYW